MEAVLRALRASAPPVPVPAAYAAAVKAKLKRERESYRAFRAVDQAEHERAHERRVTAEVNRWIEEVRLFGEDIAVLEPEAQAALEASRVAEDRAREAREYARQQQDEAERIKDTGSAEEVTNALVRADTADGVAADRQADAEKARAEFSSLDKDLREAREGLVAAERTLTVARKTAEVPAGTAPISDVTVRACTSYMQTDEVWEQLADGDRRRVRQAGEPRDMMSAAQFQAMLRETLGSRMEAV